MTIFLRYNKYADFFEDKQIMKSNYFYFEEIKFGKCKSAFQRNFFPS